MAFVAEVRASTPAQDREFAVAEALVRPVAEALVRTPSVAPGPALLLGGAAMEPHRTRGNDNMQNRENRRKHM